MKKPTLWSGTVYKPAVVSEIVHCPGNVVRLFPHGGAYREGDNLFHATDFHKTRKLRSAT